MNKTAVITGAGSGVGAATALALAKQGWLIALVGRRREVLEAVAAKIPGALVCHATSAMRRPSPRWVRGCSPSSAVSRCS